MLAAVAGLVASHGWAQKLPELDFLIRFSAPIDQVQEKYVHEALQAHEAGAVVWVDAAQHEVKVRTHMPLDLETLESAWLPIGLQVVSLERFEDVQSNVPGQQRASLPLDFPRFNDTGHPEADDADYQMAKAAWIVVHPDRYEAIGSSPATEQNERR